jgi:hypothetical protein
MWVLSRSRRAAPGSSPRGTALVIGSARASGRLAHADHLSKKTIANPR